jgi:putative flippase GtrA
MSREIIFFILNGIVATLVHFFILLVFIDVIQLDSLIISNIFAGIAGMTSSFLGNRKFVFNTSKVNLSEQLLKFIALYLSVIILHTVVISIFTNIFTIDYRISFVIASSFVISVSFLINKFVIFGVRI